MTDAFVIKYDPDGRILWKRQPGTPRGDGAGGIATDADGNVFIAGGTTGQLSGPKAGEADAFLIKLDGNGRYLWERQVGTPMSEQAIGVATDADGNVVIAGRTQDALAGPYAGNGDPFVIKFDGAGTELWRDQRGTEDSEIVNGVATDRDGNVYVTGSTAGNLDGVERPHSGGYGPFVIKYGPNGPQ